MSDFDLYILFCADGIGSRKINRILKSGKHEYEELEKILTKDFDQETGIMFDLSEKDIESLKSLDNEEVKAEYDLLLASGIELITIGSESYPNLMRKRLDLDAPPIIFCWGEQTIISRPAVAVVGSRHASEQGQGFVDRLVEGLNDIGVSIISGGARGIDKAAHRSAIENSLDTMVILAYGINHAVKAQEDEAILRRVLYLSQFHPNSGWSPASAMIRNKTVCALSSAIFVVEATESGGTVNTGETALKMGIPLYVVSPEEFKIPPPGNRHLISRGGRELSLDAIQETFREFHG